MEKENFRGRFVKLWNVTNDDALQCGIPFTLGFFWFPHPPLSIPDPFGIIAFPYQLQSNISQSQGFFPPQLVLGNCRTR